MRPPPIGQARSDARLRVAYVLSRFPKLTETFILYEILEMRRQGVEVAVHALVREPAEQAHPEARRLMPEVVFVHGARAVAWAQLTWLRRRPLVYLGLWAWLRTVEAGRSETVRYMPERRAPERRAPELELRRSASS